MLPSEIPEGKCTFGLLKESYMVARWNDDVNYSIAIDGHKDHWRPKVLDSVSKEYKYVESTPNINTATFYPSIDIILKIWKLNERYNVFYAKSFFEAIQPILSAHISFLARKERVWNLNLDNIDSKWNHAIDTKIELMKHQKIGVLHMLELDSYGLLWEPGTGKTGAVIIAAQEKLLKKTIDKVIIFCPATIRNQWKNEIGVFSNGGIRPLKLTGGNIEELQNPNYNFFIASYNALTRYRDFFKKNIDNTTMVCLDESTMIKNYTKRSRAALILSRKTCHKVIMTGTICAEKLQDVFYQIKFLDNGERLGYNMDTFKKRYLIANWYGDVETRKGAPEEVSELIFDISSRFRRDDVIEIPPCTRRVVYVDFSKRQKEVYEQVKKNVLLSISEIGENDKISSPIKLVQLLRARQITSGFVNYEKKLAPEQAIERVMSGEVPERDIRTLELENPKLDMLEELCVESDESNFSTIIWYNWNYEANSIEKMMKKNGFSFGVLRGGGTEEKKDRMCDSFMSKKINFLVVNTGTIQYGKNLQAIKRIIYYSNSYSCIVRKQSEDRAFRTGQKNKVEIIDLIVRGSIDKTIYNCLIDKKELGGIINNDNIEDILDGKI